MTASSGAAPALRGGAAAESAAFEPFELGPIQVIRAMRLAFGPSGPSTPALAAIAQLARAVRIPRGAVIAREGTPPGAAYLVIDGELQTSRGGKVLGTYGARGSVGLLAALARDRRGFGCVALSDTVALVLPAEDVLEVLEDHFELMYSAMRGLARDGIELRRNLMPHAGFNPPTPSDVALPVAPLELTERILRLRASFGLRSSYIDELAQLARTARETRIAAGTPLWSSGAPPAYAAILVSGEVQCKAPSGARFAFGAGDLVGALDTIGQVPRWFDAMASADTVALTLTSQDLADVWEDRPGLALDFLRLMARMLIQLREQAVGTDPPSDPP